MGRPSKLSEETKTQIIEAKLEKGQTLVAIARKFDISKSRVSDIVREHEARSGSEKNQPPQTVPWCQCTLGENPRKTWTEEELDELILSIERRGVLVPLIVEKIEGGLKDHVSGGDGHEYVVRDGQRRYHAVAKLIEAGRLTKTAMLPVMIEGLQDPLDITLNQLARNHGRVEMTPLDEGEAFKGCEGRGADASLIAHTIGKTRRYVEQRIQIARDLGDTARGALIEGEITFTQARTIAGQDEETQEAAVEAIEAGKILTENELKDFLKPDPQDGEVAPNPDLAATPPDPADPTAADPEDPLPLEGGEGGAVEIVDLQVTIDEPDEEGREDLGPALPLDEEGRQKIWSEIWRPGFDQLAAFTEKYVNGSRPETADWAPEDQQVLDWLGGRRAKAEAAA